MTRRIVLVALFTAAFASKVGAAVLTLSYSGVLGPGSSVGGFPFGSGASFTFEAAFDSTTDESLVNGVGIFDTLIIFHIENGQYQTDYPAGDVNVVLTDPSFNGAYFVGLATDNLSAGLFGIFTTTTPGIDADTPMPTTFSGIAGSSVELPLMIPLQGGSILVINPGTTLGSSAAITGDTTAVPEPTSLLLFGSGAVGVLARIRRRKQQ